MRQAAKRATPPGSRGAQPVRADEVAFRSAEADSGPATLFACPLCGGRFTHGGLVCASCPLTAGCDLVKCPHCGYQYPRTSRIWEWLRRRFGRPNAGDRE